MRLWFRGRVARSIIVSVTIVTLVAALVIFVPSILVRHGPSVSEIDHLKAINDCRTMLVQMMGAIGLVGGLIMTVRTFHLSRKGQLAERYSKAVELIARSEPDVAVGGIYALSQIVSEDESYGKPMRDVLTTLVRNRSHHCARVTSEVQAALTVLTSPGAPDIGRLRLDGACLIEANLQNARLNRASLTGAHLDRAVLVDARMPGADLTNSRLDGADLASADLRGAELAGCSFVNANKYAAKF